MVEYLNLPRVNGGAGASVQDAVDRSWNAAVRWVETNQTTAFLIIAALIVGFTLWQVARGRRSRY
jgi:hypothetical protein